MYLTGFEYTRYVGIVVEFLLVTLYKTHHHYIHVSTYLSEGLWDFSSRVVVEILSPS